MPNGICVLGSLNVDLAVNMDHFHKPGETVTGLDFHTFTGGKGGNQAIAAAKLLKNAVSMIACVGDDDNGKMYTRVLEETGVDTSGIVVKEGVPTGVALIEVDKTGENRIVVVPGANGELDCDVVSEKELMLRTSRVCLFQLETPMVSVNHAAAVAKQSGAIVVLDPAPAQPVFEAVLALCDFVTPNETELETLTGMPAGTIREATAAAKKLLDMGAKAVINKRGAAGALLVTRDFSKIIPGYMVDAVDTTAAGDTFNAAFAVGLTLDLEVIDAIRLANAAAAISTTGMGAQSAMPSLSQAMEMVDFGKVRE